MEIKELVTFYLNDATQTLEVSFRMFEDNEDEIRKDEIQFDEILNFGYNFHQINEFQNFFQDDIDDDIEYSEEDKMDLVNQDDIISFITEYYLIYTDKLPNPEFF